MLLLLALLMAPPSADIAQVARAEGLIRQRIAACGSAAERPIATRQSERFIRALSVYSGVAVAELESLVREGIADPKAGAPIQEVCDNDWPKMRAALKSRDDDSASFMRP